MSLQAEMPGTMPVPPEQRVLWVRFARSVRDNVMAEIAIQALRVSGMVILARELMPRDFGLFKVLLVVAVFASLACEAGVPDALIQRRHLRRDRCRVDAAFSASHGGLPARP